jgi:hypothetical protein
MNRPKVLYAGLLVGLAGLFALAERERHLLIGVFALFCCFEVAVFATMVVLVSWLLDTLQPWSSSAESRGCGGDARHSLPRPSFPARTSLGSILGLIGTLRIAV